MRRTGLARSVAGCLVLSWLSAMGDRRGDSMSRFQLANSLREHFSEKPAFKPGDYKAGGAQEKYDDGHISATNGHHKPQTDKENRV